VTTVPDDGPRDARIVVIGEAPARREVEAGRPFVGPSGQRLNEWLAAAGLRREALYVTNVVPYRIASADTLTEAEAAPHIEALHQRLAALVDPVVLVPTGNLALYALTGKGRVSWHQRDGRSLRPGVTKWRGSILSYTDRCGRTVKVIPTIHPAATFARGDAGSKQAAQWHRLCVADWHRVAGDSRFYDLRLPQRQLRIAECDADLQALERACAGAEAVAFDIETPCVAKRVQVGVYKSGARKGQPKFRTTFGFSAVACIAFAWSASEAMTVPLTVEAWGGAAGRTAALRAVAAVLAAPAAKVAQNGGFDVYWLRRHLQLKVANWTWDTRAMSHCLDLRALHSLEVLASLWTREPYYKDETKDPDTARRFASSNEALWRYCARDAAVTWEVWAALRDRLEAAGRLWFYRAAYGDMHEPLMELSLHGVQFDAEAQARERNRLTAEMDTVRNRLNATVSGIAGAGISNTKLLAYLHDQLGLRKRYAGRGAERRVSADEVALKRHALASPEAASFCADVLRFRELAKLAQRYVDGHVDSDGRMRSLFSLYTDAGRLTSRETPTGTGANLQNVPRGEARRLFLPDA
jgi:DNA polymerase